MNAEKLRALALDLKAAYGRVPARPGVCYFFPRPSAGSGCKRLNLFLRWMIRQDALDLGVWTGVPPAKLIVPLDTHVIRVGRCLRSLRAVAGDGGGVGTPAERRLGRLDSDLRYMDVGEVFARGVGAFLTGVRDACNRVGQEIQQAYFLT